MTKRSMLGAGTASLIALASALAPAQAAPGLVVQGINLRAGPGTDYPWLASLDPGTPAEIFGCLDGWSWCDIAADGIRGWAAGAGLQVEYEDQPGPLASYGPELGLPFIGFAFADYWGRYYRDRPFYSPVDRWHGEPGGRGGPGRGGPGGGGPGGGGPGGRYGGGDAGGPGNGERMPSRMQAPQPAGPQGGRPFERPGAQPQMGGGFGRGGVQGGGARPGPAGPPHAGPAGARPAPGQDRGRPGGPG